MEPTPFVDSYGQTIHVGEKIFIDGKEAWVHKQYQVIFKDSANNTWFDVDESDTETQHSIEHSGGCEKIIATGAEQF